MAQPGAKGLSVTGNAAVIPLATRIAAVGDELLSASDPERSDWAFTAAINGIVRTRPSADGRLMPREP